MNLCGSFEGGGVAREVESDRCLFFGIDFCGAMVVDIRLGICKHTKKKTREGEEMAVKFVWGKINSHSDIKGLKNCACPTQRRRVATQRCRALRYDEA